MAPLKIGLFLNRPKSEKRINQFRILCVDGGDTDSKIETINLPSTLSRPCMQVPCALHALRFPTPKIMHGPTFMTPQFHWNLGPTLRSTEYSCVFTPKEKGCL